MSNKRGLYQPAQIKRTAPKEKRRKPLAQGRLIIEQSHNLTNDKPETSEEGRQSSTIVTGILDDDSQSRSSVQVARRHLSERLKSDSLIQSETDPRRMTPHAAAHKSPELTQPSESLDLSDTESDIYQSQQGVLLVDASQRTDNDHTEVDVHLEYTNSPAKVIRHSPGATLMDLSWQSGDVSKARQIVVDSVPKVSIAEDPECRSEEEPAERSGTILANKKPLQHTVESSSLEHQSDTDKEVNRSPVRKLLDELTEGMESDPTAHHAREPSHSEERTQTGAGESEVKLSSKNGRGKKKAAASNTHEKKFISSHHEPSLKQHSKIQPKIKSAAISMSGLATKKKVCRPVSSRYMQSKQTGPMKATDRSAITKMSSSSAAAKQGSTDSKHSAGQKKKRAAMSPTFSVTPEVKGFGGKASTPTTDSSLFNPPEGVDLSTIKHETSGYHGDHSRPGSRFRNYSLSSHSNSSALHRSANVSTSLLDSMNQKTKAGHMTQKQLDISYARYVQWLYLESRARKAFQHQEQHVMEQLHALYWANEQLRQENQELDKQIIQVRHLKMLDDMLETQMTGLTPVASNLGQVKGQYCKLAAALDTTRHQMLTKDIVVPEDNEEAIKSLLPALLEAEELLGEINTMIKPSQVTTCSFAEAIQELEKTVASELQLVDRCTELTAATGTLLTQENALYVHDIQNDEVSVNSGPQ